MEQRNTDHLAMRAYYATGPQHRYNPRIVSRHVEPAGERLQSYLAQTSYLRRIRDQRLIAGRVKTDDLWLVSGPEPDVAERETVLTPAVRPPQHIGLVQSILGAIKAWKESCQ